MINLHIYEMKEMSEKEIVDFLMKGTRTGKLSTVRENGRPHVTPIWFIWNEGKIIFNIMKDSVKAKNINRDPWVSLCVDDESGLYSFVILDGTAKISNNHDLQKWATIIAGRYMGKKLAKVYGQRNSTEDVLLVKITPTKMIGQKDVAA